VPTSDYTLYSLYITEKRRNEKSEATLCASVRRFRFNKNLFREKLFLQLQISWHESGKTVALG
jgi:hypothetical protein